jgi:hypothetical protein
VKNNNNPLFNSQSSSDLSSRDDTSVSDDLDLILNQPQAKAAKSNLINGSVWTLIATGPSLPLATINKILIKNPVANKPALVPKRCSRCLSQAKKKTTQGTGKTSRAKKNSAPKSLDKTSTPLAAETSLSIMNSVTLPSNAPNYSSKGLSTKQLVAALDQDPTMELDDLFNLSSTPPLNTGINPSLVNSREASRALESSQLTPVPALIEQQGVLNSQVSLIPPEQMVIPVPHKK